MPIIRKWHFTKLMTEANSMSTWLFRLVAGLALFATHTGAAETGSWHDLTAWVGRYPSEHLVPHGVSLLEQPKVASAIRQLLTKQELEKLSRYDVETPVTQSGDYLVVDKCLPHDCPAAMAMIVIDTTHSQLWVGMFSRGEHNVSTVWYGTSDDYAVLPEVIRKNFLSRHGD